MNAPRVAPTELTVEGGRAVRGTLRVPGCKGISHRGLLFAAVADGRSTLRGLADGADVLATAACLDALGVRVRRSGDAVTVTGTGFDGLRESASVLDCENSGSTMRMLAGLVAGRDMLSVLVGDESLGTRPMRRVLDPLAAMGAVVDGRDRGRLAPITIRGGGLRGRRHELATASGQVKTALALAGMQATGTTEVVEPAPSRDHTERMLAAAGAAIRRDGKAVVVQPAERLAIDRVIVPADFSSAAFWIVASILVEGSEVRLEGVGINPTRTGLLAILGRMGAEIEVEPRGEECGEPIGTIVARGSELRGTDVGADEVPLAIDELPLVALAACFAEGRT
ncbi:MAG: 3-phosphoshikimate 1-carboxyvinyltransferase, partial [Acidimicrobiia bacterium]